MRNWTLTIILAAIMGCNAITGTEAIAHIYVNVSTTVDSATVGVNITGYNGDVTRFFAGLPGGGDTLFSAKLESVASVRYFWSAVQSGDVWSHGSGDCGIVDTLNIP